MVEVFSSNNRYELERFLNDVAEAILQDNTSLFIGAGSSMQYGAPSWGALIDKSYTGYATGSNVDRAQCAELDGVKIKKIIAQHTSSIDVDIKKRDTYLSNLLNFKYKSIWTTNYDTIIEKVLEHNSINAKTIYRYNHFQELSYPGGYFVFKINGSCDDAETIVITKEDFIDYRKSHEAYLILLKRELLCHNFLFLGCSFEDDILRICIKDILNCIENGNENYTTNHYAIIVDENAERLNFISRDLSQHYNIKCLNVQNTKYAYEIAYGITCKVKYNSVFVSGSKKYIRHSEEERIGKEVCQNLVNSFMKIENSPFKFISGMGMSIGHFICGAIKNKIGRKNINRYLEMEPFPFTSAKDNAQHRENIMSKSGIFIFLFGDVDASSGNIENCGMWKEYLLAKQNSKNIIIPLPCGSDSISTIIFEKEKTERHSFVAKYHDLLQSFNYKKTNTNTFDKLVEKIILTTRERMDEVLDEIECNLTSKE